MYIQIETLLPEAVKKGESLADIKKRAKIDEAFQGDKAGQVMDIACYAVKTLKFNYLYIERA